MSCYAGSGTGVSVWELHIVERSADGALTGYTLPCAAWEALSPLLRVEENGGRWYAMLGRELVDITDRLPEDAEPEGLRCGDYIHFAPADGAWRWWPTRGWTARTCRPPSVTRWMCRRRSPAGTVRSPFRRFI